MWQVGLRALRPGRWWRLLVRVGSLERRARGDARHTSEDVYPALRRRLVRRFGPDLSGLRVLDFGAGPAAPLTALLRRDGALALGVDLCTPLAAGLFVALRENPGRRVATMLAYLQERRMVHHLRRLAGVSGDPPLIRYGGGRLPFEDGSFDCVVSNAVLQELPAAELALYAAELRRVLGPGGVIDLTWHNFFSLSGNYLSRAQNLRRPWGHLLGGAFDPSLNGCSPDDILRAFAPYFDDLRALVTHRFAHELWKAGRRDFALYLQSQSSRIFAVDINMKAAEETCALIKDEGGEAVAYQADVSKADQVKAMVDVCLSCYGHIDVLQNNVGIVRIGGPVELAEEDWDRVHEVNLKSFYLTCKHVLPVMERQKKGVIVNLALFFAVHVLWPRGLAGPFDGAKVLAWNPLVFGITVAVGILLTFVLGSDSAIRAVLSVLT